MGAQIAALIAERGVECDLFDLTTDLVEDAKSRLLSMRPRALDDHTALERIRAASLNDDLEYLADADWVVEAIVERPEPKLELWRRAAKQVRCDSLLSTNTSGIPIARIASALPEGMRERFLGTHFFNPPRYLRLLEIIPTKETMPKAVEEIREFAEAVLGKGVVTARDVPGFITNRIGCFYFLAAMRAADEFGLSPDEADAVSGPLMGRSNSATYRTIDLVGVDILLDICDNTHAAVSSEEEKSAFKPPDYLREMKRRNWLGNKSGQGFYKRERSEAKSRITALDTVEMRYSQRNAGISSLASLTSVSDTGQRMRRLIGLEDRAGQFAWRTLSQLLAFSAEKVGEVADDIVSIDRAMRWGFNWEMGPFETWDALGVRETVERMRKERITVPEWVQSIAGTGGGFYRVEDGITMCATPSGKYTEFS
jgi:3-hydroxyacyl-CoA dehydrogenase